MITLDQYTKHKESWYIYTHFIEAIWDLNIDRGQGESMYTLRDRVAEKIFTGR